MDRKEAAMLMERTAGAPRRKSRFTLFSGHRRMGFPRVCLPIRRAPELAEVEGGAHQGPLATDFANPSEQELAKASGLLDLPKDWLGGEHAQAVHGLPAKRPQASVHPLPPAQATRRPA